MKMLELNTASVRNSLVRFIREYTEQQGFKRVILGLSGGLDSSLAAFLAVEALGKDNCIGVFMPHRASNPSNLKDAKKVAELLGIKTFEVNITPMVDAFEKALTEPNAVQRGNFMARCRMIVQFHISAQENALVMGTSNKSEMLMGYGTLHGDLACAFYPLGDLYKTQVRQLSETVGVPVEIQKKTPSADLWEGQSDEDELGVTYVEADRFLIRWVDEGLDREQLIAEGFSSEFTDHMMKLVSSQQFKRTPPPIAKISSRDSKIDHFSRGI